MRITKRRLLIASPAVLLLAAAGALAWHYGWAPVVVPPADDAYVGLSRAAIIDRLGKPDSSWPGEYGKPSREWAKQYEPAETLMYVKWHGTLYISLYEKNGQWVCFCSNWLPKGAVY